MISPLISRSAKGISRSAKGIVIPLIASFAVCAPLAAHAGPGGGGHGGGGHSAGGGHFGGGGHFAGGGHAGYGGYRAGYAGRGGYGGWHGGYGRYGWRDGHGGYGWGGGYGGWGALGLGLYFSTLPLYYSTLWDEGVPYYYADENYYQWNGNVGQYETVNPPAEVQRQSATASPDLIAYPKNGQTEAQQATDKSECHTWAAAQSGFDAAQGELAAATDADAGASRRDLYMRAQAACFEGRGYSVK